MGILRSIFIAILLGLALLAALFAFAPAIGKFNFDRNCSGQLSVRCQDWAMFLGHRWFDRNDYDRAQQKYELVATLNNPEGMFHLAHLHETRGFQSRAEDMARVERIKQNQKNLAPDESMSVWFIVNSEREFAQAATWYRRSADVGFAPAMNNLSQLYAQQLVDGATHDEALRLLRKARNADNPIAAMNFYIAEILGIGMKSRPELAEIPLTLYPEKSSAADLRSAVLRKTRLHGDSLGHANIRLLKRSAKTASPVHFWVRDFGFSTGEPPFGAGTTIGIELSPLSDE